MSFKTLIHKVGEKSSIHGIPYLLNPRLHLLEKIFWLTMTLSATYFSISICWNQWQRFRNSPIIHVMELTWGKNDFPYPGITLCSDYVNEKQTEALLERIWAQKPGMEKYDYYRKFLDVVNVMRYDTMYTLKPYKNDSTLANVNFLNIVLTMQETLILETNRTDKNSVSPNKKPISTGESKPEQFAGAITEAGLCRTISQLNEYTNPYGTIEHLNVSNIVHCAFLSDCSAKIFPKTGDEFNIVTYIHNVDDIVAPNDRSSVMLTASPGISLTVELIISWTTAETEVRDLPIAYRKCRYPDENYLEYFKTYRPGLCRIECRINAALALCQCKPYFYAVAPNAPICDIEGMLCLVAKNWTNTKCDCMKQCIELNYIKTLSTEQNYDAPKFERTIIVKLSLPRMSLKRRVVFSTDQLIVSFGGSIGLFIGTSFISIFRVIFLVGEYFGLNMVEWCGKKCKRVVETAHNKVHPAKDDEI